jgi:RimJ/RimL family protein N-acetyltransferase
MATIRFIRLSDLPEYKSLRPEALRAHPEAFGTDYEEDARQPESIWTERIRNAIDGQEGCIVVAEDEHGALVGMAGVYRQNRVKVRHSGVVWGVYVRREFRGQCVAGHMIERGLEWCKASEIRIARLTVVTVNSAAIRCYLRCGFKLYGISPEEIRIGESYYDEMLMYRRV